MLEKQSWLAFNWKLKYLIGYDASGMRYLSLDLPFIEKADQVKCRDPRLQTIINVFPNSWAQAFQKLPLYY